jgi:hypothetical protein
LAGFDTGYWARRAAEEMASHVADPFEDVEPVDIFDRLDLPPAPLHLLPAMIGDFCRDQAAIIGVDPGILAGACLTATAAAIDDGFSLRVMRHDPFWVESARLWTMIVGPPSCKKSPALKAAMRPLRKLDVELANESNSAIAAHQVDLEVHKIARRDAVKAKARGEDVTVPHEPARPALRRITVEDTTVEAMSEILKDNPRGILVHADELAGWIGSMDAYRNGAINKDRAHWLEAYNGGARVIDRVSRGSLAIKNWSASIIGGIQPGMLAKHARSLDPDGLLARFIPIVAGADGPGEDRQPDFEALDRYREGIRRLFNTQPSDERLTLADDAHQARREIDNLTRGLRAVESISPGLAAHLGKWPGLFGRLCLVFHIADFAPTSAFPDKEIPGETAHRVADFMRRFLLPHAFRFYTDTIDGSDTFAHAQWLAGFILSRGLDTIAVRDIARAYKQLRKASTAEIQQPMELLSNLGWTAPGEAIDSRKWAVNPKVHERFASRAEQERVRRETQRATLGSAFAMMRGAGEAA